jgi:hypothetical protein
VAEIKEFIAKSNGKLYAIYREPSRNKNHVISVYAIEDGGKPTRLDAKISKLLGFQWDKAPGHPGFILSDDYPSENEPIEEVFHRLGARLEMGIPFDRL